MAFFTSKVLNQLSSSEKQTVLMVKGRSVNCKVCGCLQLYGMY